MKRWYTLAFLALLSGCSIFQLPEVSGARLADFDRYEIVAIDGGPPIRRQHTSFVTVVPFVVVSEGLHLLTVRRRPDGLDSMTIEGLNSTTTARTADLDILEIHVVEGRTYRLNEINGHPVLREEGDKP